MGRMSIAGWEQRSDPLKCFFDFVGAMSAPTPRGTTARAA
jgi:hypothetical protein